MNHQKQFYEACKNGILTQIMYLLNTYNIDVHAYNEDGFRWACYYGYLNVVQYLLKKTKMTNEMLKILSEYKYFDEIKIHACGVKIYNYDLRLCKILFPLYNTINVENSIYLGLI